MGKAAAPAGGQCPIFALDVVNDRGLGPAQERRKHQADTLAGSGWCDEEDMLGPVVAQVAVLKQAEDDASPGEETRSLYIGGIRPASRAIGRRLFMAGSPGGSPDGDSGGGNAAEGGERTGAGKDVWGLSSKGDPPRKELPGWVYSQAQSLEPGLTERWLVGQHGRGPLRGGPDAEQRRYAGKAKVRELGTGRHRRLVRNT